jgi:hypothetical protein
MVSKTLPAGSYVITAAIPLTAQASGAVAVIAICTLSDGSSSYTAHWWTQTDTTSGYYEASTTLPLTLTATNSGQTTASVTCQDEDPADDATTSFHDPSGLDLSSAGDTLTAVQTTSNS